MRWLSLSVLLMAIAAAVLFAHGMSVYHGEVQRPLLLESTEILVVPPGQGSRQIIHELADRGWVRHPRLVELYTRSQGIAGRLQAGEYEVPPGISIAALLDNMYRGVVIRHRLTIPEGWTAQQFLDAVATHPELRAFEESMDLEMLMHKLGHEDRHPEGWFLPDTYVFNRDTASLQVVRLAHEAMVRALDEAWESRIDGHPVQTPYELLILASIVEKETGQTEERGLVAGVFVNRLRKGMRLQTDPTLLYAQPPGTTRLTRAELRRDHAYNTYTREGLPPTPIALPGKASLMAAARPTETDALFFVSRNDGTHVFSATYAEHRAAVIQHQLGGDANRYGGGR
jgi:UPF0755 protein